MIIDLENQMIKFNGEYVPENRIIFTTKGGENVLRACKLIKVGGEMWYKGFEEVAEINKCQEQSPVVIEACRLGSMYKMGDACIDEDSIQYQVVNHIERGNNTNFYEDVAEYVEQIHTLNNEQKGIVKNPLMKHAAVSSSEPGCTHVYELHIRPIHEKIHVRKYYPVPLSLRAKVDAEIDKMMNLGIIERGDSPYCNPLRIVAKKDGTVRVCLDARFLNSIIASDNESPENINDLLQHVEGVQFMSTTDFVNGYWQVPLAIDSRKYIAFLHNGNYYQFKRIPFGLKTVGSGFIRAVSIGLGSELLTRVKNYIDDFLIASKSFVQHVQLLDKLFTKLSELGFTLSLKKSKFFCTSVKFLGVIINNEGVQGDPDKLRVIQDFPCPKDLNNCKGSWVSVGFPASSCLITRIMSPHLGTCLNRTVVGIGLTNIRELSRI